MQLLTLATITSLLSLAHAQSSSSPPLVSATASPSSPQRVSVGSPSGGLVFQPNVLSAPVGSTIEFHFYPRNHSVVQGPFDQPCKASPNGVYSGFFPVSVGEAPRTFSIKVNDTNPIWFYCSQSDHCQDGMAMVVNPPDASSSQTLSAYFAAAKSVQNQDVQSPPAPNGGVISGTNGTAAGSPTPGGTPTSTSGAGGSGSSASGSGRASSSSSPGGAVAVEAGVGGVLGAVGAVLAALL